MNNKPEARVWSRHLLGVRTKLVALAITASTMYAAGQIVPVNVPGTDTDSALALANAIKGTGIQAFENVTLIAKTGVGTTKGGISSSAGTFSGGLSTIGFGSGIILSTGGVHNVPGPNTSAEITQQNATGGDADLAALIGAPVSNVRDRTVLEFDFVPTYPTIAFRYVFSSDEFNEWANSQYNDVFGFFVNGTGAANNIARIPGTSLPVAINTVNGGNPLGSNPQNPQYFINNTPAAINVEMDGLTVVFTAQASVTPGETNHIKIAIADVYDQLFDSNVFIEESSFVSGHAPVAVEDGYKTPINTTLTVIDSGVLANDTDADNNLDHAALIDKPAHGTVSLNAAGGFTYIPVTGYSGPDSFTYLAVDATNIQSNLATVSITVGAANSVPSGSSNTITVLKNAVNPVPLSGFVFVDADVGNALTAVKIQSLNMPAGSALQLNGVDVTIGQVIPAVAVSNGQLKFTPATGEFGSSYAQIFYQVSDGVSLSGTQELIIDVLDASPEIAVYGNGQEIVNGDATPASADHTDFGSVSVATGLVNREFTISNTGTANLSIEAVSVSGANPNDFIVTIQPGVSVAPAGSTTFTVQFDPSADGVSTAVISFLNSDGDESPYTFSVRGIGGSIPVAPEIAISGNGVEIASGDTTPALTDHTDFGAANAVTSGSVQRTFTISNEGTALLNLTGTAPNYVSLSGSSDFSLTTPPTATIAASSSATFAVTFAPTSFGTKTATVTVASNDSDEGSYSFTIQGVGGDVPAVVTAAATTIKSHSTKGNGTVNPKGLPTVVAVEYSTDSAMNTGVNLSATQNLAAADSVVSIEQLLTSLMPETTYYFRIVATNDLGTIRGGILSFTTKFACTGNIPMTDSDGLVGGGLLFRPATGVINNAGRLSFNGYGMIGSGSITNTNEQLLLSDSSGALKVVAREANQINPGETLSGTFLQILLTEGGRNITLDRIVGAPASSDYAYLSSPADNSSLVVMSREGDAAPGGGNFLSGVGKPASDAFDRIYFQSALSNIAANKNSGIWYDDNGVLHALVKQGDNVSSVTGDPAWLGGITAYIAAGGDGCAFIAALQNNPDDNTQKTNGTRTQGLFSASPGGSIELVARRADAIPAAGGTINTFSGLARGSSGDHAYIAVLTKAGSVTVDNDSVLMAHVNGVNTLVAQEGVTVIDGGLTVKSFGDFYITRNGEVIFKAVLNDAVATEDVVLCRWTSGGGIELLAREGRTAADSGLNYGSLQTLSVSDGGAIAISCLLSDGNYAVMRDKGDGMKQLVRTGTGQTLIVEGVTRTIQSVTVYTKCVNASGGGGGMGAFINDAGDTFVVLGLNGKNYVARIYR